MKGKIPQTRWALDLNILVGINIEWKVMTANNSFHLSFLRKNVKQLASSSILNVRICCFSLLVMKIIEESLGFGVMAGRKKQFEDAIVGSGT